ncbi:hypothetical protein [Arundinibacter roseus]|uniref:Beta-lactamase-inhibitor-like PepSY-like domain-containing protein n=1 Tax=Arundinibacter roseus TaxID=2070510 RepID=A0A4R4K5C5_9BACT|nr:hypothetical protein [Arundinibacter roseus]TDB61359.1 hypothetical protein EZE20_19330 [Arundinibacter roseus]
MKKSLLILAAFLGLFMMSCQPDAVSPLDETAFEDVLFSAARYSAEADSTTKSTCKGKLTELAAADIPAAITTYITTTYAGATVKFAGTDAAGNVVVGLTLADGTAKGLLFDNTGSFQKELARYKQHAKLTEVATADLPAAITAYVTANYSAATIKHAGTNEAGQFFVMLSTDMKPIVLVFEADGTFVQQIEAPKKHGRKKGR